MVFLALIGLLVLSHTCEGRRGGGRPGRARSPPASDAQTQEGRRGGGQGQAQSALSDAQAQFRGCPKPGRRNCRDGGTCDEGTCTEIAECPDPTVSYCKVSHMILHPVITLNFHCVKIDL